MARAIECMLERLPQMERDIRQLKETVKALREGEGGAGSPSSVEKEHEPG